MYVENKINPSKRQQSEISAREQIAAVVFVWRDALSGCSKSEVMELLIQMELSAALGAFRRMH